MPSQFTYIVLIVTPLANISRPTQVQGQFHMHDNTYKRTAYPMYNLLIVLNLNVHVDY